MISKIVGMILKKNSKNKWWWGKLGLSLVISNLFFFLLFGGKPETQKVDLAVPKGWVEIQLQAELLTPFHSGKKILLVNRPKSILFEGMLEGEANPDGKITVRVKESEAAILLESSHWEILPYLANLKLKTRQLGASHEIRY